jgi:putative acetyltransferase
MQAELIEARTAADYADGRALFEEYARQLGVDLCFQNFAHELDHLPAMYGPPAGALLLARLPGEATPGVDDRAVACVGVRALTVDPTACEMKRLYVRPEARATGVGRRLAAQSLAVARARGYRRMVLDTLRTMTPALSLYASLGFRETAPYYANPLPEVVYLSVALV